MSFKIRPSSAPHHQYQPHFFQDAMPAHPGTFCIFLSFSGEVNKSWIGAPIATHALILSCSKNDKRTMALPPNESQSKRLCDDQPMNAVQFILNRLMETRRVFVNPVAIVPHTRYVNGQHARPLSAKWSRYKCHKSVCKLALAH